MIYLTDKETNETIVFPMMPEKINVKAGAKFRTYVILDIGDIDIPGGELLTIFSWDGILPGEKRKNEPYVFDWVPPQVIQEKLSYFRSTGKLLHLLISNTPINHDVWLDEYSVEYSGGYGDYTYSVTFKQAKQLVINTINEANTQETSVTQRSIAPKAKIYTVKTGDTLWKIAQSQLGSGGKYMEIASLNNIANPNIIIPGQTLKMP
jgi:nucleoid-associated protein YgaU